MTVTSDHAEHDFDDCGEFDFDSAKPIEQPFKFQGRRFILREATTDEGMQWRNAILRSLKPAGPNGEMVPGEGMPDTDMLLLSMCVVEVTTGKDRAVKMSELRTWPNSVTKPLFLKARTVSKLGEQTTPPTAKQLREVIAKLQQQLEQVLAADGAGEVPDSEEETSAKN